jgi:hypothetical protein
MTLKSILEKYGARMWPGFGSGYDPVVGFCEYGDETSGSIEPGALWLTKERNYNKNF